MLERLDLRSAATGGPLPASSRRLATLLPRPRLDDRESVSAVHEIVAAVRERGDDALRELTARFDGAQVDEWRVPPAAVKDALGRIPDELRDAIELAAANIEAYHRAQLHPPTEMEHDGIRLQSLAVPVERAGCYVPGGRARYPSTVLMTAVVAKVAGVPEVVLATPPAADGSIPDVTLAAAAVAGVDEVYRVGGAQAIAALAYGTRSIAPVDVIVGPGNAYVALAKRAVALEGVVGVPSAFTGPSEVVVLVDGSVRPDFAAIDVIVQAEHGPGGLAWLISWDANALDAVEGELGRLLAGNPRRGDVEATFASGGHAVLVDSATDAMSVSNAIAPEHLELLVAEPERLVSLVRHAGAVFTGPWSPASVGDYVAGPSHVLPTFGTARFGQALNVGDFRKHVHVVTLDEAGLRSIARPVAVLATEEGLFAHAQSVRLRVEDPS
jgi:histidinol dehydrogenase